jgi:hypothetical protein
MSPNFMVMSSPTDDSSREAPRLPEVPMDERGHLLERLLGD